MKTMKGNHTNSSISSNASKPSISYSTSNRAKRSVLSSQCKTKMKHDPEIILHISCMNCGSHVAFDQIDCHASKCIIVTEEVAKNEKNRNVISSINYKLRKLKEHLTNIILEIIRVPKEYDKEMKFVAAKLSQCITESLHIEDIDLICIKNLKQIIKELDALLLNKELSLSANVYIDRTKALINAKLRQCRETIRLQSNNNNNTVTKAIDNNEAYPLTQKNSITAKKYTPISVIDKRQVVSLSNSGPYEYNSEIQMKSNNDKNQEKEKEEDNDYNYCNYYSTNTETLHNELLAITEVNNKPNYIVSTNTSISYGSRKSNEEKQYTAYNSHYEQSRPKDKENVSIDVNTIYLEEEKLKKEFYKAVFKIKFKKLHSSHKGQHISHSLLWNECQKMKIPQEKWKSFIFEELNNPCKYSIMKMKTKKKFLSQNFTSMAIIDEETQ